MTKIHIETLPQLRKLGDLIYGVIDLLHILPPPAQLTFDVGTAHLMYPPCIALTMPAGWIKTSITDYDKLCKDYGLRYDIQDYMLAEQWAKENITVIIYYFKEKTWHNIKLKKPTYKNQ
jgi:hypothetical protein